MQWIRNSISANFKNLLIKWEKYVFHWEKMELWYPWESCAYCKMFGLRKGPDTESKNIVIGDQNRFGKTKVKYVMASQMDMKEHQIYLQSQYSCPSCNEKCFDKKSSIWKYTIAVKFIFLLFCFLSLKQNTFDTRKNVNYFTSKALFIFKIIKFSFRIF